MTLQGSGIGVTFSGAHGVQFGKNTYMSMVPYNAIERFMEVFPEVQRKLNRSKVNDIAKYVLHGLSENNMCCFPAVTATCHGDISFDTTRNTVTIDLNARLSINDGQHRVQGIKVAIKELQKRI